VTRKTVLGVESNLDIEFDIPPFDTVAKFGDRSLRNGFGVGVLSVRFGSRLPDL